ncbi:nucleoid occlusion protein [Clostridium saccharobutylicum]|uniref:Nucleoid occlusion protein Noc n=1 Tax=Clostridium saccharobutylicum DSM 13864 TaxID=1345695 RepID=U5MY48_CLOSA|nr:nucleoid occlusion protein [Clostridium saccharobutylicum]AGX45468.1 nucleoid occlusion protein Noc [Clostridium saccharobutylicum DSM 13864]AQR92741.1 nucleoid occlusion protein [Clostridium saccharobutylicum]AQS02643.1 nucleoid occlusion protein [Clostridium saccharobutylicum]AQS12249.1 nucleoid occlusion protein [Clostridium saccharobutylicum]AQS16626.1 nucleoid occlusion protein [Clostridium saccharobutylicum]
MNNEIVKISVDKVVPNIYQPRKCFNEDSIDELSKSIRQYGIIQPLTVRKMGEVFELVAGERRLRAAKLADLETVPCNVIDITDSESAEIALLENLQREDLNYIEEAEAYYNLINEHNFTQDELAKRMGKKQSTIANKLRLLKLSSKVREICLQNKLTERHSRALLTIPNEELQLKVVQKVIKDGLNVKKTEELINKELLKLAGKQLKDKRKRNIKSALPAKLYVNTIKQVLQKFDIPAEYGYKDEEDFIEVTVKIPKVKK